MRRNQLTITYPEGEAQQHHALLLLKRSHCLNISAFCREVGATGGSQMKTIAICLPDEEAAMLIEVHKRNKDFIDLRQVLLALIKQEYEKAPG
jgi:hypothetical protein